MTAPGADHARVAYDTFAPAYDRFTADHDQRGWSDVILGLAMDAGLDGRRVLEVGCGTGSAMVPMLDRGYELAGVDISPMMVARAGEKLRGRAEVAVADMRGLPRLGDFDLVWALCDAVNYLLNDEDLVAAFSGMRRNLTPGGIAAFDVTTLVTLRRVYSSISVVPDEDDVVIFRGSSPGDLAAREPVEARVEHLHRASPGEPWSSAVSIHCQRHHDETTLRSALLEAGLEPVSVSGVDTRGGVHAPLDDLRHHKAVYIARRSA